jgi:hypothetical protein
MAPRDSVSFADTRQNLCFYELELSSVFLSMRLDHLDLGGPQAHKNSQSGVRVERAARRSNAALAPAMWFKILPSGTPDYKGVNTP